ncbi:MAG: outer membrane protein assembly factor BamA [Acidobacteriota bacterium]
MRHILLPMALAGSWLAATWLSFGSIGYAHSSDNYVGLNIQAVRLTTEQPMDTTGLIQLVTLPVGGSLTAEGVRQSIEALYQTHQFSYIEVDATKGSEGVILEFRLRPNFFFADFRLAGDAVLRSPLSSLVQLPLGEVYSRKAVEDLLVKVRKALQDAGYYRAEVIPDIQFRSQDRLVTVRFVVQAGPRALISGIEIEGNPLLERQELLEAMKRGPGDAVDSEELKKDLERLRRLYSNRGFLNATIRISQLEYAPVENNVKVRLFVDAGAFVYVELQGAKIPNKQLRSLVPIYEEGSIDQDLIEEGKRNIEDYFEKKGYFDVTVGHELIEVPDQNAYQINYSIDRGQRQKVVAIDFQGISYFSESQLLGPLNSRRGGLTSRGKFSQDLIEQDAEVIRDLYLREGFEKVEVQPSFVKDASDRDIRITFSVREGPQTFVASIATEGNSRLPSQELLRGLNLAPGRPFSAALLEEDRRLIESKFQDRGYGEVKAESVLEREPSDERVKIVYRVAEGTLTRVDDIYIVGNRQTRNKIIGRNISFHEGDPLSQEQMLNSQQSLYGLGLFNRVDIVPINVRQADHYRPVIIRLEDSSPIIIGYGAGYQDREGPRGTIEISHNNLFGLARSISFRTRASFREQRGQITYKEPRLFNRDLDSFITLFAEKTRRVSFDTTRTNATIQVLKRFRKQDNFFFRYNFETVDLSDVRVNPLATGTTDLGTLQLSSLSSAWLRDSRDDPLDPSSGYFHTANFSLTSKLLGSQANFVSFFGQTQAHRKIGSDVVLATSLRLGLTQPYGSTAEVPISERFFAGGSTTLRGFGLDRAGPLDPETNAPLGGNALVIGNVELRVPVTGSISFVPFYDTGNVFSRIGKIALSSFTNTVGFGLRYKTPFGPLRVDLGFNLDRPAGFRSRQIFFTVGNPF